MLLISIDPGSRWIGVALKINEVYSTLTYDNETTDLYELISPHQFDAVIIEQYSASNVHSNVFGVRTCEIIGAVEAICWFKQMPMHRRTAVQRMPGEPKAVELIGAMRKGGTKVGTKHDLRHEISALAHLICWERQHAKSASVPAL